MGKVKSFDGWIPSLKAFVTAKEGSELSTGQVLQNFHFAGKQLLECMDECVESIEVIVQKFNLRKGDPFPDLTDPALFTNDSELWTAHLKLKSIIAIFGKSKLHQELQKMNDQAIFWDRKLPSDEWLYEMRYLYRKSWSEIVREARVQDNETYQEDLQAFVRKHAKELHRAGCTTPEAIHEYIQSVYPDFWKETIKKRVKKFAKVSYEG